MSIRINICLVMLGLSMSLMAQDKHSYTIFCPDNNYKPFGSFIGAGASVTWADPVTPSFQAIVGRSTNYSIAVDSRGLIGYSGEVGALFIAKRSFIRLVDFGFNYRLMRGEEIVRGVRSPGSDLSFPELLTSEGRFKYHRVSFRLNAQSVIAMGNRTFIHLGPGIMITESVGQKSSYDIEHIDVNTSMPEKPTSNTVNFTIGIGMKVGNGRFINLYGHAPLLSLTNANLFDTSEQVYNSTYKNGFVGLRFIWMRRSPDRVCPAMSPNHSGSRLSKRRLQSDFHPW